MAKRIPEQKGPIVADQPTYRSMTHGEKVSQAQEQARMRRSNMTLTLHQPKTGRK
jgi:hypothetical protein